jgi:hypothetical protein
LTSGILGSKPGEDPLEVMSKEGFSITQNDAIRWSNRKIRRGWSFPLLVVLGAFIGAFQFPVHLISITIAVSILLVVVPSILNAMPDRWTKVSEPDIKCEPGSQTVRCKGLGNAHVVGMDLRWIPARLPNSLAQFIRALPMEHGFCLSVAMSVEDPDGVLQQDTLDPILEKALRFKDSDSVQDYFRFRYGLWKTRVTHIGLVLNETESRQHIAAVKGALPSKEWHIIRPKPLETDLMCKKTVKQNGQFYMVGEELTKWLVQLRSELSQEVGINIPGQFLIDIRPKEFDYELGNVLNPDTLRQGPAIGLTHDEISEGLLVCGGSYNQRREVLTSLIRGLITNNKRVLIITNRCEYLQFTALSAAAVGLRLGKDLVLNPIDSDGVPRTEYVPQLLSALEVFTESNLGTAASLEIALNRAVALGNATIADVKAASDEILTTEIETSGSMNTETDKQSKKGFDAIARLYEGTGARAFYGTQSVRFADLTQQPLSVIVVSTGTSSMDMFAADILSMKLTGLEDDKDLVVILDQIEGLRVTTKRYSSREPWVDRITRRIADKFSLVVSSEHPSYLGSSVKNLPSSCISLRMRSEDDIASVNAILGFNVISHGLHSKARWSPRETTYLRTMEDGHALLVRDTVETCQPIRLLEVDALIQPSSYEMKKRLESVLKPSEDDGGAGRSLIARIASGKDSDLVRKVLRLLERYEPLTEEAMKKFIQSSGDSGDIEGIVLRLREAGLILEGHESHAGVSYKNYRLTMKGTMTLRQLEKGGLEE